MGEEKNNGAVKTGVWRRCSRAPHDRDQHIFYTLHNAGAYKKAYFKYNIHDEFSCC
jgi:hypothetical protein